MDDEVTKLRNTLQAQREEGRRYRSRAQVAEAQLRDLLPRIEALEAARPAPTLAPVLSGLAEIRRDVEARLQEMRVEIDDLAATVAELMRQP